MPRISQFYGIIISMYYRDHPPPHFHAIYGDKEAIIDIQTGSVLAGRLSRRALALVREWAAAHGQELLVDWDLARNGHALNPIAPLD